jgi:hypothetical protein
MKQAIKTRRTALATALCAAGCLMAGQASATPNLPADTTVQFKYNNLEIVVTQTGQQLEGIFDVTGIGQAPTGLPVYFSAGGADGELNGIFSDLTVALINGTDIYFTGGTLSLYDVPNGSYDPSGPGDSLDDQVCGGPCGTPWLTMDFVPGTVTTDNTTTAFDETTTTLFSTVSSVSTPLTGTGDGLLEITGGSATQGPGAVFAVGGTMSIQSNLQSCPDANNNYGANCVTDNPDVDNNIWPIASFDPVVGSTTTIPEPETLLLMGGGLMGLGYARRRRRTG